MAGGRENLNLQSETSEFMDQPSVQRDHHVVSIPSTTDASSIVSSSAATAGFPTLNSPCEGVPTTVSTSAANAQGRSHAPGQQRSRWNNPCSWLTFDFYSISIQTILMVVFLSVFRDEYAHVTLQAWVIGYGVGWLLCCNYKRFRERSNQLPQAVSVSPGSEVGVLQSGWRLRFWKILKWLWRLLDGFLDLWFGVGLGIVHTHWITRQAPHLNWLCTVFLVSAYLRVLLLLTTYIAMIFWCCTRVLLRDWTQRANANVISALPTYKFHALETNQANKEDNDVKVSIGGDERVGAPSAAEVAECCICLGLYEDGVELKELPCMHHLHVQCIDRWLKISGSCPVCKSEVGTSIRESATEPAFTTITVY